MINSTGYNEKQSSEENEEFIFVDFNIYPFQYEVFYQEQDVKFKIVTKGRRVGFTYGAVFFYLEKMVTALAGHEPPIRLLWGDVNYTNINKYLEYFFANMLLNTFRLPKELWSINMGRKELRIGDSVADFRSATRPQTWEGFGYNHVFLNEAGIILNESEGARYLYDNSIRPMMLDYTDSRLIAGGVPKLRGGVFYDLYQKALDPKQPDYRAYNFTSFDNPKLSREQIKEYEESIDSLTAQQEIYGQFVDRVGNPFAYAFDASKHVGSVKDDPMRSVILSFDFNVEPMTCLVILESDDDDAILIMREYRLLGGKSGSDVFQLCERLSIDYGPNSEHGNRISFVTGDASGFSRSAFMPGNMNAYIAIQQILDLAAFQIRTPASNPSILNSRMLTNSLFARHPKLVIDSRCQFLIEDLRYVEVDTSGGIEKSTDKHKTHLLDCLRYYFHSFHYNFIKELT